jgi:hypothetical protein
MMRPPEHLPIPHTPLPIVRHRPHPHLQNRRPEQLERRPSKQACKKWTLTNKPATGAFFPVNPNFFPVTAGIVPCYFSRRKCDLSPPTKNNALIFDPYFAIFHIFFPVTRELRPENCSYMTARTARLRTRQREKPARRSPKGEAWAGCRELRPASQPSLTSEEVPRRSPKGEAGQQP